MRRTALLAVLLSIGFFVISIGLYLIAPADQQARQKCFVEERDRFADALPSYTSSRVIWPPGIRCTYHELDGDVTIVKSYGTGAWVSTALSCAVAGTATAFGVTWLLSRRRHMAREVGQ